MNRTILSVLIPAIVITITGCSSTTVSSTSKNPAPAPQPVATRQARIVDPFGSSPARSTESPSMRAVANTPVNTNTTTPANTETPTPAMQSGVSSAPQFSIYGELPRTGVPAIDQNAPFDPTENVRRISFAGEGADFDPCPSADGKTIYFASTRHRPTADIYAKSVDGTAVTQLTSDPAQDVMPTVSPDGKRIAFASNRNGSWDLYIMNAQGGQALQITSDPGQELHPTWSPDGKWLAFCRTGQTSDRWEIWVTDTSRSGVMKFLTYGLFPSWQPGTGGGNKIAFQRSRERGDRFFSIWTVDYVGGEAVSPTEIISSPVAAAINPTWSPDGTYLAFSTVLNPASNPAPDAKPQQADIWIVRADGSARTNITSGWFTNLTPSWGADNRIYFVSNRSGTDNLWSIGPEQALVAAGDLNMPETNRATAHAAPAHGSELAPAHETDAQEHAQPVATAPESPAPSEHD